MIDFAKELKKYEPVVDIETRDEDIAESDAKDVMELLQYLFTFDDAESGAQI